MKEIENTLFDVKDSYNNIISRKTKLERFLTILSPSSEFRSLALEKYIQIYNDYLDEICALVYPEIKITFAIDKSMRGLDFTTFSHKSERTENYASLSRGRKKRVDIITQLAFYRLLEVFSSVKFDLVVFDEIFDGLDSMGIEMIIKAIEQLWSNMKVYIVSHNEQLKGYFEKTLTIEMADGASQIVEI
jgi:DNA repair exonuclease SbcCD ATPase subunit